MIGDDGLHNRQAQAGAVLFGRVVRREQALALLVSEPFSGIGDVQVHTAARTSRPDGELAALRHGVDRIQQEVLQRASELFAVGTDGTGGGIEVERYRNRRLTGRRELRLE